LTKSTSPKSQSWTEINYSKEREKKCEEENVWLQEHENMDDGMWNKSVKVCKMSIAFYHACDEVFQVE
jgi:hypothetical protein